MFGIHKYRESGTILPSEHSVNVTFANLPSDANARIPISVTVDGIIIDSSSSQLLNAPAPIVCNPSFSTTVFNFDFSVPYLRKQSSPTETVLAGSSIETIARQL